MLFINFPTSSKVYVARMEQLLSWINRVNYVAPAEYVYVREQVVGVRHVHELAYNSLASVSLDKVAVGPELSEYRLSLE